MSELPNIILNSSSKVNRNMVVTAVIIGIISCVISFYFGWVYANKSISPKETKPAVQTTSFKPPATSAILTDQKAFLLGKITGINKGSLSVDFNKQSVNFPVASNVQIYKFIEASKTATSSSDLKNITLNVDANITLKVIDGEYKVINITYLPSDKFANPK